MEMNKLLVALGGDVKLSDISEITKQRQMSMSEAIQEISSEKVIEILGQMKSDIDRLQKEVEELKSHKCSCHG